MKRSARFFLLQTHFGKVNGPRKANRNGGCERCGRLLVVLVMPLVGERLQPFEPNSQSVIFLALFKCAARYQRTENVSGYEVKSHTKVNEVRQWRPKWRRFK